MQEGVRCVPADTQFHLLRLPLQSEFQRLAKPAGCRPFKVMLNNTQFGLQSEFQSLAKPAGCRPFKVVVNNTQLHINYVLFVLIFVTLFLKVCGIDYTDDIIHHYPHLRH